MGRAGAGCPGGRSPPLTLPSAIRLPWTFPAERLAAEVRALTAEDWVPHFNTGIYAGGWDTATLREPITEGRGRIQIDDTVWRVAGPDLPVGAQVRVVAVKDSDLVVAAV